MKKFWGWSNLLGVLLIIIGGVSGALTGFLPFIIIMFIGVILFVSFPAEATLPSYVINGTKNVLVRKRYYANFFLFSFVISMLTLGHCGAFLIPYRQEYYIYHMTDGDEFTQTRIKRKEYMKFLKAQRKIYSTKTLDREFMDTSYTVKDIGLKRKTVRLVLAIIFTALSCMMCCDVLIGIWMALFICIPLFLTMVILWIPDYRDAKIIQRAYDRAMAANPDGEKNKPN
ncbi:MAG: hypothetical protein IKT46_01300 [Clostridia bacterium]|nr:hypothetical protein [Clostridia bacterium]